MELHEDGRHGRRKLFKLTGLSVSSVALVDTPANRRRFLVVKNDEAKGEAEKKMDEELLCAYLDVQNARLEAEAARTADIDAAWRDIEKAADDLRKRNPHLSGAEALSEAVRLNPELARRYELAQNRPALEENLRQAEARYKALSKAAALQKRHPDLSRDEALRQVFAAEPELFTATTGTHV